MLFCCVSTRSESAGFAKVVRKVVRVVIRVVITVTLVYMAIVASPRSAVAATGGFSYTVKDGDSLWVIGERYHVSVDAIRKANSLKSDFLELGRMLYLPGKNGSAAAGTQPNSSQPGGSKTVASGGNRYTVKDGDCLEVIAGRCHTSVDAIKQANGMTSDFLMLGRVLTIPGKAGKAVATNAKPASTPKNEPLTAPKPPAKQSPPMPSRSGDHPHDVVSFAQSFLGTHYQWAGESPSTGFDCSGFTKYILGQFGVSLPHSAAEQYSCGVSVAAGELAPGDILLFHTTGSGIDHAAIYCGDDKFIHASSRAGCVRYSSLGEEYWRTHLIGARRVL